MVDIITPAPHLRVPAGMYSDLCAWMLEHDPDAKAMMQWSGSEVGPPSSSEQMAYEIIWIILCAGRSAQSARTIEKKVLAAIRSGTPVVDAFGYRAKADAIERAWRERELDYANLGEVLATRSVEQLVQWCRSLRFVGDDTMFQLAKNFGAQVCKPDIWLCRLTGFQDRPRRAVKFRFPACMALCRYLADSSGHSISQVDSMTWLACNKGVLEVDAMGGPVSFVPREITAKPIMNLNSTQ
jgi:hypothetical protein